MVDIKYRSKITYLETKWPKRSFHILTKLNGASDRQVKSSSRLIKERETAKPKRRLSKVSFRTN